METTRQQKVARLVQREVGNILQRENSSILPGKIVSVTVVRVTPDLGIAKIYLSIYPNLSELEFKNFTSEYTSVIRFHLGRKIRNQIKSIPELQFYIDDSMDYIENIDRLLKK